MTQLYFDKFPTIDYANTQIKDLSRRVVLPEPLRRIPTAFYPYDLTLDMRSDVLAHAYYKDTDADWLIYLTNGIVDPYYGWYLSDDEFENYIVYKYGSPEIAEQTIDHWTTNWMDDVLNVTPGYYERLAPTQQKYYIPVWGAKKAIIAYKRRAEDWVTNTNKILNITVANSVAFSTGALVQAANGAGYTVATGQVIDVPDTTHVVLDNVLDLWNTTDAVTLQLRNTPATNTAISAISTTIENISDEEFVFWTPITQYEKEKELNESRKSLLMLDAGYLYDAANGLQKLLAQK